MDPKNHWETIYRTKDVHEVSWFQSEARRSVDLITRICSDRSAPIIDVGGGASVLVDNLLAAGYRNLSVLDVSEAALKISRDRLGADSAKVNWMVGDVLRVPFDDAAYYSAEGLYSEFGTDFQLVRSEHEDHHTPGGAEQSFLYCLCRRE